VPRRDGRIGSLTFDADNPGSCAGNGSLESLDVLNSKNEAPMHEFFFGGAYRLVK
jgi:hypothetical protein